MDQITNEFAATWLTNIRQFQSTGVTWFDIEAQVVDGVGGVPGHLAIALAGTGASPSNQDHGAVGRVFLFKTAIAGRKGHGRIYIPGTPAVTWQGQFVHPTALSDGVALVNNLKARYTGASPSSGLSLVICPRSDPGDKKFVTDIQQRALLGLQRRRMIGVGF